MYLETLQRPPGENRPRAHHRRRGIRILVRRPVPADARPDGGGHQCPPGRAGRGGVQARRPSGGGDRGLRDPGAGRGGARGRQGRRLERRPHADAAADRHRRGGDGRPRGRDRPRRRGPPERQARGHGVQGGGHPSSGRCSTGGPKRRGWSTRRWTATSRACSCSWSSGRACSGLEILCAGKDERVRLRLRPAAKRVTSLDRVTDGRRSTRSGSSAERDIRSRRRCAGPTALTAIPQHTVPDLVEMGLVANATGLVPDVPAFHAPIARTPEIADILVPVEMGGILHGTGRVDVVNSAPAPRRGQFRRRRLRRGPLRGPEDLGGPAGQGPCGEPCRRCGDDLPTVASAGRRIRDDRPLRRPCTGARPVRTTYSPASTWSGGRAGHFRRAPFSTATGHHHQIAGVDGLLVPARRAEGANPVPFYMMADQLARARRPGGNRHHGGHGAAAEGIAAVDASAGDGRNLRVELRSLAG